MYVEEKNWDCEWCGETQEFLYIGSKVRWCSNVCKHRQRYFEVHVSRVIAGKEALDEKLLPTFHQRKFAAA